MIKVKKVRDSRDMEALYAIRKAVFVDEQNCPPEIEWEHEEDSTHFLAFVDKMPSGVARWRQTEIGYKLERFAVLKQFRGRGVGQALLKAVLLDLPSDSRKIYLHAQVPAVGFYEKFNFHKEGEEFEEAGIRHYTMSLKI